MFCIGFLHNFFIISSFDSGDICVCLNDSSENGFLLTFLCRFVSLQQQHNMEGPEITFLFQFGNLRDMVTIPAPSINLKSLKELACDFINSKVSSVWMSGERNFLTQLLLSTQIPENGLSHLSERLLLFRHDYKSSNILQLVNSAADVIDETLIEIVLTSSREYIGCVINHMHLTIKLSSSLCSNYLCK